MTRKWNRAFIKREGNFVVHEASQRWTSFHSTKGFQEYGMTICISHGFMNILGDELVFMGDDVPVTCLMCLANELLV